MTTFAMTRATRDTRFTVTGERWAINARTHIKNHTFRGDGSFNYSTLAFEAGADGAVLENCEFINCFRGPVAAGGNRLRFVNCRVIFDEADRGPLKAQFGFYMSAGEGHVYEGCRVEYPRLDGFKPALGVSNVKYTDCHVYGAGVAPSEGSDDSQEGGAWDLYASGDRQQLVNCSSEDCYGTSLTIKTFHTVNPPNVVGNVEVHGYRSIGDYYGIALEALDTVDFAGTSDDPGVRPEAQVINIIGGIIRTSKAVGLLVNTRHVNIIGTQVHETADSGIRLYRSARDVNISDAILRGCSNDISPLQAGLDIRGAQRVTVRGGLIDGANTLGVTKHIVPIVVADKVNSHGTSAVDDIVIDKVRMRNYTTSANTQAILCASATCKLIVDTWSAGDPNAAPGTGGGPGSICRRLDNGALYKKTSAANVATSGWVELQGVA